MRRAMQARVGPVSPPWRSRDQRRGGSSGFRGRPTSAWPGRRRGTGSIPAIAALSLAEVRRRLAGVTAPASTRSRLVPGAAALGGAGPAVRDRRRDARAVHQAARDDVDAQGRDRVSRRQARARRRRRPLATALREAREEIGLDPAAVEIVAGLDGVGTVASRFTITPFVGFLARLPELRREPGARWCGCSKSPLSELLDPAIYHEERWDGFQRDMSSVLLRAGRRDGLGRDGAYPDRSPHSGS